MLYNIVWHEKVRERIGDIIVGLTILLIASNMVVIVFASIRPLCRKCYLRNLRKKALLKYQEEMKIKQEKNKQEQKLMLANKDIAVQNGLIVQKVAVPTSPPVEDQKGSN